MTNAGLRFAETKAPPVPWTKARFAIWVLLLMALAVWGALIVT
jgi:hypothetical protein